MAILADFGLFVPWIHSVLSMEFIPGAKIWAYTDPQHGFWLLHRIWDHMTPWIFLLFFAGGSFWGYCLLDAYDNKLYNKLSNRVLVCSISL